MNMLSKVSALGFVAPLLLNGAVKAEGLPVLPSPSNPNPPPDQARSLAKPVFIAQVPSQVAHQQPGRSNLSERPSGYGEAGAAVIVGLEDEINTNNQMIRQDDQNLVNQAQQNDDKFQQLLRNRQPK